MEQKESTLQALNRLCKWRNVFAGWQLGTRLDGDAECNAVRDHREVTILLRAEASAIVGLLIRKGVFTEEEFAAAMTVEARQLNEDYERLFPGFQATEWGMEIDTKAAAETTKNWRP